MQDGYEAREPSLAEDAGGAEEDDPVIAFLFAQESAAEAAGARGAAGSSRTHSRLTNNRGALYLPTHNEAARGRMVQQW
jgi:hypothetical protein